MKHILPWWTVLPASALVLGACKKETQQEVKTETKTVVEKAVEKTVEAVTGEKPAPAVKALTPAERAAILGFVGHLSKDTESVVAVYDGKEIVKRLRSLKLWQFIRDTAKEEDGTDPEEEIAEGADEAGKFLGQEFFLATGKGTAPQVANLMKLNQKSSYYQFRFMSKAFAEALAKGDMAAAGESMADSGWMKDALKDIGKEMALVENAQMPPIIAGIKAADAESLGMAQQNIASSLEFIPSMAADAATPVEFTKGGVTFKGYKLSGSVLAASLEQERESMEEMIAPADVDRLIAALKLKNLVISQGTLDNYLLVYLGASEDECPLVDKVEDSLAANDQISFIDGSAGKKVVGFLYGDDDLLKATLTTGLKEITDGVRDGIAGAEGFGETRDLVTLLDLVGEKEKSVLALAKADTMGGVALLDQGVKFETYGGIDQGAIDVKSKHKLDKLRGGPDTFIVGNWVVDKEYQKRGHELGEALVETAYALAGKVATFNLEDNEEFAQFKQYFGLFDEKFRGDLLGVWEGVSSTSSGLGQETALIVDLQGTVPPIPGVPKELVDNGKFVRASLISPVDDRSKLGEGWDKVDGSLRNVLKTVSEMTENEINMQKPITSEKNGLITYFFSFPFFNDDFLPSVSVSDKWFVASTSKTQTLDLAAAADSASGDRTGAWLEINLGTLRKFSGQWLDLVEKNVEKVIPAEAQREEFVKQLPRIRKALAASEELDAIDFYTRSEGGKLRSTLHFKTRETK